MNIIIAVTVKKQGVWGFFYPGRHTQLIDPQTKKHKPMSSAYSILDVLQVINTECSTCFEFVSRALGKHIWQGLLVYLSLDRIFWEIEPYLSS